MSQTCVSLKQNSNELNAEGNQNVKNKRIENLPHHVNNIV